MRLGSPIRRLAQVSALTLALSAASRPCPASPPRSRRRVPARPAHAADDVRSVPSLPSKWRRGTRAMPGPSRSISRRMAASQTFRGAVFYGHRAFEDRHVEIFRTFFKGTKLAMTPTQIRFVHPDVAIADIATVVSELGGRTSPGVQARPMAPFTHGCNRYSSERHGDWSIASYHNVDVKGP